VPRTSFQSSGGAIGARQGGPDLGGGRQVPQQDVAAPPSLGRATPAKEVAFLPWLAAEAAPQNAELDPEFSGQRRQDTGMTERIRRVQHVEPATESLGVRRAKQQVTQQ
jgi:hypothetical protein